MSDPFADYKSDSELPSSNTSMSCSITVLSLIATLGGWIGGLVIFILEKQNTYVRAVALQSFVINLAFFLIVAFALVFIWVHTFFIVMFCIFLVIHILVIVAQAVIAFLRAKSGVFLGIPPLGEWFLQVATRP